MIQSKFFSGQQYGDIKTVADILGISRHNAQRILSRPNAKRHAEVKEVLQKVIESRNEIKDTVAIAQPQQAPDNKTIIARNIELLRTQRTSLNTGDVLAIEGVDFVVKHAGIQSVRLQRPGRGNHTLYKVSF